MSDTKSRPKSLLQRAQEWAEGVMTETNTSHGEGEVRTLGEKDIESFVAAAESRPEHGKLSAGRKLSLEEHLSLADFFRFRRMKRDHKWVRKQAEAMGIHPSQIPWGEW